MSLLKRFSTAALIGTFLLSLPLQVRAGEDQERRVAYLVQGRMAGGVAPAEEKMATQALEGIFQKDLKEAFGTASFDQDSLAKLRAQEEQWKVIAGGSVDEVQKALKDTKLDAVVRIYYRTAPAYQFNDGAGNPRYAGTAMVTAEVISMKSGEKGSLVWSPPMGALGTGETKSQHPAKQGEDAYTAGMAALKYAAAQAMERLKTDPVAKHILGGEAMQATAQPAEGLRAVFILDGVINGSELNDTEQRVGAARLEAVLNDKLRSVLGLRSFDDSVLQKVRQNAEEWAVLNGDDIGKMQELLDKLNIDAAVRVFFRTAPAHRKTDGTGNTIYSGTANVNAQIISKKTGEKSEVIISPTMGTVEHPARRALDAFDASMSALDYASEQMVEQLKTSPMIETLKAPDAPVGDTGEPTKTKVIFAMKGDLGGEHISMVEQRVGAMALETMLDRKLRKALGLQNFDESTLQKIRQDAEQWAVLMGGDMDEVQGVLDKHNVDSVIRVTYSTEPKFHKKDENGNAVYYATANVEAVVMGRTDKKEAQHIAGPKMGTTDHKAKAALDPYDAGMSALDYATDRMVQSLQAKRGELALMQGDAAAVEEPEPVTREEAMVPGKPTVAVLWVKPTFGYWSIPRARQPGLNMRKRKKMKSFVDHVKKTGNIGVEVAYFLVQGLSASGALLPVEKSGKAQEEMAAVQNKLLEYRMAGWVKGDLPISEAVTASREIGADYVVTAKITKIWEKISSISGPFVSKGKQAGFAECELTITNVATGTSKTYKGTGSMGKSGYGTFTQFDPANMALDRMMIGGAIKEALFNAAKQVKP